MDASDRATLEGMVRQVRTLPGETLFDSMMKRHQSGKRSATPPLRPHRLVHLVDRVQNVLDLADRGEKAVDVVAFRELRTALELFAEWPCERVLDSPGDLKSAEGYRHAFVLRAIAAFLSGAGNEVEFVQTKSEEGERTPDLRIGLGTSTVDTEIKSPEALEYPRAPLTPETASLIVEKALRAARRGGGGGQLARQRDAVLLIGGTGITRWGVDLLRAAAMEEVQRLEEHRSRIVGIGFVSTLVAMDRAAGLGSIFVTGFALNTRYVGRVRIGAVSSPSLLPVSENAQFGTTNEVIDYVRALNAASR